MSVSDLNSAQAAAVEHRDGPLMVLAGPGSGKTRVITRRIAHIVQTGVFPSHILALTFTNKAATEMAHRVQQILPGTRVWVSTFHRFCARVLRRYGSAVGLQPNFSILDGGDQSAVMRSVLSELDIDSQHFAPSKMLGSISRIKNRSQGPEEFAKEVEQGIGNYFDSVVARVFKAYQDVILRSNAVDFDDLLTHVGRILVENAEIREMLSAQYRYVLVDEYQDTNFVQYQIVRALAHSHRNLCITGDPDQSIYGWRGAEIGNFLKFEQDFPEFQVIRLEQNYRSTQSICHAADSLIINNRKRKHKDLFTENPVGSPVKVKQYSDQFQEADGIAQQIKDIVANENRPWSDFAIFYRVNALSRSLELALGRHHIPYQVAAGLAFYDRAEVKDLLAYLRLIVNPSDDVAFARIVNTPRRGIGETTVRKLLGWAATQRLSALDAARRAGEFPGFSRAAVTSLGRFAEMIDRLSKPVWGKVTDLVDQLLESTKYLSGLSKSDEADMQKIANIAEFRTAAVQYDEANANDISIEGFLENSSLVADLDGINSEAGSVTLMTMHAAKGLEYPVVFIAAVEDGILPHERTLSGESENELEEERRLLFVGVTRAREHLFLSHTFVRDVRGQPRLNPPSRFLQELALKPATKKSLKIESPESDEDEIRVEAKREKKKSLGLVGIPLTTGKSLLEGTNEPVAIPTAPKLLTHSFRIGLRVRHPQFGPGTVTEVSGEGKKSLVKVTFPDGINRSFMAQIAPLQPIGLQ